MVDGGFPEDVREVMTAHNELSGDGPLQPLPHPDPCDHDVRLFNILSQGVISTPFHEFGQSSDSAIGSQLRLHDIHGELLRRVTEVVACGGWTDEGFVAFIRPFSDSGRSIGLGIGFVDLGSCPLEERHRGVGEIRMQGPNIPCIRKRRHTVWRQREPKTVGLSHRED